MNRYPLRATVRMRRRSRSARARRTSLTQWVRDSSVTVTDGHIALINSSFETSRPAFSTRYCRTAKLFGRSCISRSSARTQPRRRSSVNPAKRSTSSPTACIGLSSGRGVKPISPFLAGFCTRFSRYGFTTVLTLHVVLLKSPEAFPCGVFTVSSWQWQPPCYPWPRPRPPTQPSEHRCSCTKSS